MILRRLLVSLAVAVIAAANLAGCGGEEPSCADGAGGGSTDACAACEDALNPCLDACKDDACKDACYTTRDSCMTTNCHYCG